jgi:phosphoribosyl 1,2-cyclic phosphodiesterase
MRVISFASGSSGNCYLVQSGATNILIDSGLSASQIERYLLKQGVLISQLAAIFLTHEHSDHLKGAGTISRRWGVPVIANHRTLRAARPRWDKMARMEETRAAQFKAENGAATGENPTLLSMEAVPEKKASSRAEPKYNLEELPVGGVKSFNGLEVSSVPVSHDAEETVCYTLRSEGQQVTILTDLGCATAPIFEPLYHSHLIVLEANHDLTRLHGNPHYPQALKGRIASDRGHLNNEQSAAILRQVIEHSGRARTVWLAHLSEENNDPKNAVKIIRTCLNNAGITRFPLQVALRDKPSLIWDGQQALFQSEMLLDFEDE